MGNEEVNIAENTMSLADLKKQRGSFKGRITTFEKYVARIETVSLSEVQRAELRMRIEANVNLFQSFDSVQSRIEESVDEIELIKQAEYREAFENQYYSVMSIAKCLSNDEKGQVDDSKCPSVTHTPKRSIKLPEIRLPSFNGSLEHWIEYRNSFVSMIHKRTDLDAIEKFHYLNRSLSGTALDVISELDFTAANYSHAWSLLEDNFSNNRLLIQNHVSSIFTAQSIKKASADEIRNLINAVLRNLRALKSLHEPTDSWDTVIIYLIVSKLDAATELKWEDYKNLNHSESQIKLKLEDLLTFLRSYASTLDTINKNKQGLNTFQPNVSGVKTRTTAVNKGSKGPSPSRSLSYISTRNNNNVGIPDKVARSCIMCGNNHLLYTCVRFLNLSVLDRIKFIDEKKVCRNCLRAGHSLSECKFGPCRQCDKKHNSLLHSDSYSDASRPVSSVDKPVSVVSHSLNTLNYANIAPNARESAISVQSQVLLSTAIIEVRDSNNHYQQARVLLDSGSQNSFISEELCNRLDIPCLQSTMRISGVGQTVSQSNKVCEITMRSLITKYSTQLRCYVLPRITSNLPSTSIKDNILRIPNNIRLADPTFNISANIDLLIGCDKFWDLVDGDMIRLSNGPYLRQSKLGWLVSGPILSNNSRIKNIHCHTVQTTCINNQLRNFWLLEEIPGSEPVLTKDERMCEESFIKNTKRDATGRYVVRMPLRESPDALGDSFNTAKSRFLSLERKLERLPSYKKLYCEFMREYIELGHMAKVNDYSRPYYFLPHHGVFREHSTTTKLRVVFDGSAITTSNKSLNDIQLIGPPLQTDIFSLLLRFRQYKYVACADVEKMYRQILLHPDQRNLQLILWRENPSDELGIYQLQTVTYGLTSSPYLSIRCLRQLANETDDKEIARVITEDFFVDDLITGHDNLAKLLSICERTTELLQSACFPLRKWIFNHDVNVSLSKELNIGENCNNKTLGLGWHVKSDDLYFSSKLIQSSKITKRTIMSIISQIYDPLGILCPIIISAKIMIQKLWLQKLDWDDPVPHHIEQSWKKLLYDVTQLNNIRIPRYVLSDHTKHIELHIFTDASQDGYGGCAYIRTYDNYSCVKTMLLCGKSKVAPVKPTCTIPRLELCGALVGARLYNKIINSLRLTFTNVRFWTDSKIIIGWMRMPAYRLKTFVSNRVSQINELTGDAPWYHIPGKDNPADLLSRGVSYNELLNNQMWWYGPVILREEIPHSSDIVIEDQLLPELKDDKVCMVSNLISNKRNVIDFHRFSSLNRLQRSMAYVLRFIHNVRARAPTARKTGLLSADELQVTMHVLARLAQIESFGDEHNELLSNKVIRSKRILNLHVFLDDKQLIRVGGRLINSPHFVTNKKHPVLLCSKHKFTVLLFEHEHKLLFHGGPQAILASIREAWWPLRGRDLARSTVHRCVKCVRMKGTTIQPRMGNLPPARLEPGFPFMRCGVDYAGPLMILNRRGRGAALIKGYICLFICMCTRAVHLELVTSLSTSDYILALKRFISRRGKPIEIYSDNAKNFIGAEKEIVSNLLQNSSDIENFSANHGIKFSYIPPQSPHFGGMWESGVKACKYHLRRVVGGANLTYEELSTVLTQIEAIMNSRPMTALSSDPNDLQPLTPAHFLIGRPLTALSNKDVTATPSHRLPRYDIVEQMRQHFWKRWSTEYVSELQTRTKWSQHHDDIKLNALVLIKEDNLPPLRWRLGRVIRIYPGSDGISRVADLRTATGILRRSFAKMCPLPVHQDEMTN